jgi:hypothetical protein
MAVFLDTRGNPTLGIGLCDRCKRKFPLHELHRDPNSPGLRVCEDDRDEYDPYRLPARAGEIITLPFIRPDFPVASEDDGDAVSDDGDDFIVFSGEGL